MHDRTNTEATSALAVVEPQPAPTLAVLGATPAALTAVLSWLELVPHDLATAARAAGVLPSEALCWFLAGQLPGAHPDLAAFSAEIAQRRAKLAADNYGRMVKAAEAGDLRAIERLDALAEASQLAAYPGRGAAEQIRAACYASAADDRTATLAEHDALPPSSEKP